MWWITCLRVRVCFRVQAKYSSLSCMGSSFVILDEREEGGGGLSVTEGGGDKKPQDIRIVLRYVHKQSIH